MRIHNIYSTLASPWVILSIVTWLILILIAGSVLTFYGKAETLKSYKNQLNLDIAVFGEKKDRIESSMSKLNLEDKKLSAILTDLLNASKKSGARLGETSIAELSEQDDYKSLPVTISVKGNYNQIGKFINLVEKNLRFNVIEVNLSTKQTKGAGIICKIKAEFIIL